MRPPIIFLDIDGVLLPDQVQTSPALLDEMTDYQPYDPGCVEAMNAIIAAISPVIVLHSSRRYQYSQIEFCQIFIASGILTASPIVLPTYGQDAGLFFSSPNREKEHDISEYLRRQKICWHVVLDDEVLNVDRLHLICPDVGLTVADARTIIAMLTVDA